MELINNILRVNEFCEGDCIIVGGACSFLNNKKKEIYVRDIDIVITEESTLDKLSKLGEIKKLRNNPLFGLKVGRYSIKREDYTIDIFLQEKQDGYEVINIEGKKIKKLKLETQIDYVEFLIEYSKKINKDVLVERFNEKLIRLCA
mgnify:CR=1 FL=1|jgi:hypothetical protein|tara:strand:+ start:21621 stop:22058 length:438 start_codon:yes stop_codon:yes gene_type:complete